MKLNENDLLRKAIAREKDENAKLRASLRKLYDFIFDEHCASSPDFVHGDDRDHKVNWPANQVTMNEARVLLAGGFEWFVMLKKRTSWTDGQPACAGLNCHTELKVGARVCKNANGLIFCSKVCLTSAELKEHKSK